MAKKDTSDSGLAAGIALGATLAAAVAGGIFLYGPKGAQNRKKVRAWSIKAKAEVLQEIEKMKAVTEEAYNASVDKVAARYQKIKDIQPEELLALTNELKKHWKEIKKQASPEKKPAAKRGAKKTKPAKKAS